MSEGPPWKRSLLRRRKSLGGLGPGSKGFKEVEGEGLACELLQKDDSRGCQEDSTLLKEDHAAVFGKLRERDSFHQNRWRCLLNTRRAVDTLEPWARLDLHIVEARDLPPPRHVSKFGRSSVNTCVFVFSDDHYVYETPSSSSPLPSWTHHGHVNIIAENSMIRFHIMNDEGSDQLDGIGFVEVCVSDIPFDSVIEGWFELRFDDHLQKTSGERYSAHCRNREDARKEEIIAQRYESTDGDTRFYRVRQEDNGICAQAFACARQQKLGVDFDSPNLHFNAGEIRLRLELRLLGSWTDKAFGFALSRTHPVNFGQIDLLASQDMQGLYDGTMDFKLAIYDDCWICVLNYWAYLIQWKNFVLSLVHVLCFMLAGICPWLQLPIALFLVAMTLAITSFTGQRQEMTLSGENAPLNHVGFGIVARQRNTDSMFRFIERVVENQLGATIENRQALWIVAARCFREGKPLLPFSKFQEMLRQAPWVTKHTKDVGRDSLVMVDERYCAKVVEVDGKQQVRVVYQASSSNPNPDNVLEEPADVDLERVAPRPSLGLAETFRGLLPDVVDHQLRRFKAYLHMLESSVLPTIRMISGVLSWQGQYRLRCRITMWASLLLSLAIGFFREYYRMCGIAGLERTPFQKWMAKQLNIRCANHKFWNVLKQEFSGSLGFLVYILVYRFFSIILFSVMVYLLLHQAKWLLPIFSGCRVCRRMHRPRRAPQAWAFFRPDIAA